MDKNSQKDPRFAQTLYDPRFDKLSLKNKKIKIDERFQEILENDEKFDKTKDLYYIEKNGNQQEILNQENSEQSDIDMLDQYNVDSDEEKAPLAENSSKKLVMQNFDWRHLKSPQIYLLFESLIISIYPNVDPKQKIQLVELYKSDFGEQNLKKENEEGPREILENALTINHLGKKVLNPGKLRQYERERLKYFYSVITFDNKFTAEKIYDSFDGLELEMSGMKLDLRILPEGLQIPKSPIEECYELNEEQRKKLPNFISKAQGHTDVELTWDQDFQYTTDKLYQKPLDELKKEDVEQIVSYEDESSDGENLREEFLKQEKLFSDFNKKNDDDLEITFKVGFGDEDQEYQPRPQKQKISKRQFIKNAQQKKLERKQKNRQKQELELLVNEKQDVQQVIDIDDPRFNKMFSKSDFAIDPTNPKFDSEKNQKFLDQKRKKKISKNQLIIFLYYFKKINYGFTSLALISSKTSFFITKFFKFSLPYQYYLINALIILPKFSLPFNYKLTYLLSSL